MTAQAVNDICATCDNPIDNSFGVGHCSDCCRRYGELHGASLDRAENPEAAAVGLTLSDAAALLRLADRYPEQLPPENRVRIRAALLGLVHLGQSER